MTTSLSTVTQKVVVPAQALSVSSGKSSPVGGNSLPLTGTNPSGTQAAGVVEKPTVEQESVLAKALAAETEKPDAESVEKAVARLNDLIKDLDRDLQFSVDEDTGRTILKVIHAESGEVIRQIPPEELLHLARAFAEGTGSLIKDQA